MIIYQTKKPVESLSTNCVGVTGDNLAHTQEFYIKGIFDNSLTYALHLRFADGSVNTIIPDTVQHDGEGTGLRWVVKKNDIFMHGYFELQIEGRNDNGMVFQTEIIELYADESIPVEEKEYENPNSETIKLRDEAYELVQALSEQQAKLEENAQLLDKYDLTKKLDNTENVIKAYHLSDYSVRTEKLQDGAVTNDKIDYGAVGEDELSTEIQDKINEKLDGEVGIGTLYPYESQTSKINSANFDYQKVGSWVDLQVYVDFKAFEPNNGESLTISGLPYVCKNSVNPRELCVSSNKNQMIWAIQKNSATLTLILTSTTAIIENEKLSFSIRYKIA